MFKDHNPVSNLKEFQMSWLWAVVAYTDTIKRNNSSTRRVQVSCKSPSKIISLL